MQLHFQEEFTVRVDASACTQIIAGYDRTLNDTWYYSDQMFRNGKIYGLVSEYGLGCAYLSYFLGGRVPFDNGVRGFCNDEPITQNDLREAAWCLEPNGEPYGKKRVQRAIEAALQQNKHPEGFQDVAERFLLTPERFDRKFIHLSGERWRAAAALGYALGKRIFFAPYKPSVFYHQMCRSSLLYALRALTDAGALVVLPTGSDTFIRHIADEVVYLDPNYDTDSLRQQYGAEWVKY